MSQYYVQRSSSLVLVPEEFPLLQWSTTRSSSQSLISTELLEDNTSCSCLEMFASISKLFERIYKPGAFFINALSLTNTLYSGMKNKLSLGFSDTKKKIEKNRRVIDPLRRPSLATFRAFFAFAPLPFLHIPVDSRTEYVVFWIQKTVCDIFLVYIS